jgi:hypothetical protein
MVRQRPIRARAAFAAEIRRGVAECSDPNEPLGWRTVRMVRQRPIRARTAFAAGIPSRRSRSFGPERLTRPAA